jgi:hydrogenase nickel incorporation protein HypA/HybF
MHELSIADSIVRIAAKHARGRRVERVVIRVGALRQVVPDALGFAFELVSQGTLLDGAVLELEPVATAVECRGCGAESELTRFPLACAACGSWDVEVIRGEELSVDSLDVVEEAVA